MPTDIERFQAEFVTFQDPLKAYLYRLLANRSDAEDLAHDTFVRAFSARETFAGQSSLKTWVFRIATNLALNHKRAQRRWREDVTQDAKALVRANPALAESITYTREHSAYGSYEVREHIATCFACVARTLPIEQQMAVILKDVYGFAVADIELILERTNGAVKYLLQQGRGRLTRVFERKCALVNKAGACHQCSELNGWLNPAQTQAEREVAERVLSRSKPTDAEELYALRAKLVAGVDPLRSDGHALQEVLMRCNVVAGEG